MANRGHFHKRYFPAWGIPLVAGLLLCACTQSQHVADLEKRIADADARTEAAEKRIKMVSQSPEAGSAPMMTSLESAKSQTDRLVENAASNAPLNGPVDGDRTGLPINGRAGPTHDEP